MPKSKTSPSTNANKSKTSPSQYRKYLRQMLKSYSHNTEHFFGKIPILRFKWKKTWGKY